MLKYLFILFSFCFFAEANEPNVHSPLPVIDYKQSIIEQQQLVASADSSKKGRLLSALASLYLKDQNQELAFETFLESLDHATNQKPLPVAKEGQDLYAEALTLYFKGNNARETAREIIKNYAPKVQGGLKTHPLAYLLAIAYANLNQFEPFFDLFYNAYEAYPDHFLAYKTKGILHIKLLERKRTEQERLLQRGFVLQNFNSALDREPNDVTLYKLIITFSPQETKAKQVQQCLNKIIDDNIIIPRSDIIFYVKEAMDVKEKGLAQRFVDKASEWYKQSRIITAAQEYIKE